MIGYFALLFSAFLATDLKPHAATPIGSSGIRTGAPPMTPIELQQRGMEILIRELGYADAMRFMLQFTRGRGD